MADSKISALTDGGAVLASDQFAIARSGASDSVLGQRVTATYGTSPPSSPVDGDVWIFPADDTHGVLWTFVYHSAETTYKWRFIGGSPMRASGQPSVVMNAATQVGSLGKYYDPTTMSVTVPRAGDYIVEGFVSINSNGGSANFIECYVFAGSALLSGNRTQSGIWVTGVNTVIATPAGGLLAGVSASTVVGLCADSGSLGTYKFLDTQLVKVTPIRVI